jgi:hypothetical protein
MFYADEKDYDKTLRFGDVISGFIEVTPIINDPTKPFPEKDFKIDVVSRKHFVVLTPCCSISEKIISITPLREIRPAFFDNPFLDEDLTRINRTMSPDNTLPPKAWEGMSQEEKEKRLNEGDAYAFMDLFIYKEHPILPRYALNHKKLGKLDTGYYMIDLNSHLR